MRLTFRGRVVAAILVGGFLWGTIFGIQAISAIVVGGSIALLAGWMLVRRNADATVRRETPQPGFPGEERPIHLRVDTPAGVSATVIDELPSTITPAHGEAATPVRRGHVTYDVTSIRRGVARLGPARVVVTDPFGLIAEDIMTDATVEMLTYPEIVPVRWGRRTPELLPAGTLHKDRHEFDRLREYEPGDAPRDIHWKSSAKRACTPLIVKEFVSDTDAGDAHILGMSEPGGADAMASAVASLVVHLLDTGVGVGVRTSDIDLPVETGDHHRTEVLTGLAQTNGGRVKLSGREPGSIVVSADAAGRVSINAEARTLAFDEITVDQTAQPSPRLVADGGGSR